MVNKENAKARRVLSNALEKKPDSLTYRVRLADLDRREGKRDQAIEAYEKIREQSPENPKILLALASLYEEKGALDKTRKIYEDMQSRNPGDAVAANNLAFFYAEYAPGPENLEKAERILAPFFEKNREAPAIADTMAWIHFRKGDYDKARVLLEGIVGKMKLPPSRPFIISE